MNISSGSPFGASIDNSEIEDGTIQEAKLETTLQGKVNSGGTSLVNITPLVATVIQGTWGVSANPVITPTGWHFNNNAAEAINDAISWKVKLAAGTYSIHVIGSTTSSAGILTAYLDAFDCGDFDFYSAGGNYGVVKSVTGITLATSGHFTFKLITESKNASSSNYNIMIQHVIIEQTA